MALLWMDGFDHYGTSAANLTDGAYAQTSGTFSLDTASPATGTHALKYRGGGSSGPHGLRKVLPGTYMTIGGGFRLKLEAIPTGNNRVQCFQLRSAANAALITICIQADGSISVKRDGGASGGIEIANSGNFKLTAGIYQHVEFKLFHSATVGTVEVRVDRVTVINATGLNTTAGPTGQLFIGGEGLVGTTDAFSWIDDLYVWDAAGSHNNDFIGPKSVFLNMPNGDTAEADMTPVGSASGYGAVNETTPDGDTSYLQATVAGDRSEFDLANLPPEVTSISAIMLFDRSRKSDSGDANVRKGLVSGASVANGADNVISTAYAWRGDVIEVDPATGAPMTPSAFNAAKMRLERTV